MSLTKINVAKIVREEGLAKAEAKYRGDSYEAIPFAQRTTFVELASRVFPDRDGPWRNPVFVIESRHRTTIGSQQLCVKTLEFMEIQKKDHPMDILSVSSKISGTSLVVIVLARLYGEMPDMTKLYDYLGERDQKEVDTSSKLIVPEGSRKVYTQEELEKHRKALTAQEDWYRRSTDDLPFLNGVDDYTPQDMPDLEPGTEPVYDLKAKERQLQTLLGYEEFNEIYVRCKKDIISSDKYPYFAAMHDEDKKREFLRYVASHVKTRYVMPGKLPDEDFDLMMQKLYRAFFEYDVLQDLIDDPDVTDIKVTGPYNIRVNIKGKFYISNVTFLDDEDYDRFIVALSRKNNVNLRRPVRTFTDNVHDANYILRFTVTSDYITSDGHYVMHIGKQPRKKLMYGDLVRAGMMPPKVGRYLMDRARHGRGVVIAGPPRSGKTVLMNWLFEDGYEPECEILIIQENDELFPYRKGVTVQHVVLDPPEGYQKCTMSDLGEKALVAGCNVFIIGEAKGGEIYHALTLANSGCRAAITMHSESAAETIDKMVMLTLMSGYITSIDMAKRMLRAFDTIVYVKGFKVQEITEVTGFNEETKDLSLKSVYRLDKEKAGK